MKRALILGAAFALLSSAALAQSETAPTIEPAPAATSGPDAGAGPNESGKGGKEGWRRGADGPGPWRHWRWGGGPQSKGMMGMMPRHGMAARVAQPSKGAHVVLERGRMGGRIDVKCADNDSTEECVAAVKSLIADLPMMPGGGPRKPPAAPQPERGPPSAPQPAP